MTKARKWYRWRAEITVATPIAVVSAGTMTTDGGFPSVALGKMKRRALKIAGVSEGVVSYENLRYSNPWLYTNEPERLYKARPAGSV